MNDKPKDEEAPDDASAGPKPDAAEESPPEVIEAEWQDPDDPATPREAADASAEGESADEATSDDDAASATEAAETAAAAAAAGAGGAAAAAFGTSGGDAPLREPPAATPEPKRPSRGLIYGWLAVLTICVVYVIYLTSVAPNQLRDRMALAEAPAVKAGLEAGAEAGRKVDANTAQIQALQAGQEEVRAAVEQSSVAAGKELGAAVAKLEAELAEVRELAEAARALSGETPAELLEKLDSAASAAAGNTAEIAKLPAEIEKLTTALADAEARVAALEERARKNTVQSLAKTVLALNDLRTAVASGKPFATLLERAQAARPEATELKEGPWVEFADTGLPQEDALLAELQGISVAIGQDRLKDKLNSGAGWLDRAVGGIVERLKVRRVGSDVEGDDPAAVAARAEAALADGDLDRAIAEVEKLDGDAAARFAPWLAKAKAKAAAGDDIDAVEKAAIAAADGA